MHALFFIGAGLIVFAISRFARGSTSVEETHTVAPGIPELPLPGPVLDEMDLTSEPDIITHSTPAVDKATQADIDKELASERTKLPVKLPSPLSGVTDAAWTAYINAQRTGKLNTVTPGYALGIWGMGMRALQDVKFARDVKLTTINGRQVWRGPFVPPMTEAMFLSDAQAQYEAFKRLTVRDANYLRSKFADVFKAPDSKVTLSGMLAVAKYAGLKGSEQWLTDPTTRKPATTAQFEKFKGYF